MLALELASAVKRYGARAALDGVSLGLAPGAALGLLGPNGAGKTTALRLLLGFVRPDAGGAALRGRDPSDPEARRGIGYLPERLVLPERATRARLPALASGPGRARGRRTRGRGRGSDRAGRPRVSARATASAASRRACASASASRTRCSASQSC